MPLAPPVIKIVLLVSFIILSSLGRRPTESRNGGDVQMRHRIVSQGLLEQLSIELQELARVCRASIRDDKADIEILRMLGEPGDEALLREVHHNHAMLNFEIVCDTAPYLNQCGFPPGHQHYVDSRGRDLPRELSPYAGRGARHRSELSSIKCCFRCVASF